MPNRFAIAEALAARAANEQTLVVTVLGNDRFADPRGAIDYSLLARLIENVKARLGPVHAGLVARLSASKLEVVFGAPDVAAARAYASHLQSAMTGPIVVDGIDVDVGFTIGLAVSGDSGGTRLPPERASIALGRARKAMIGIAAVEASGGANPAGNLSLMSDMPRSIGKVDISNHYQPKYDPRSGELVAVEALARWRHPERGAIMPDQFIPLAEETGRIREPTLDVLARAVWNQAWPADRGHKIGFVVNLSGRRRWRGFGGSGRRGSRLRSTIMDWDCHRSPPTRISRPTNARSTNPL